MAIPPIGANFNEFYASVIAELGPKQVVLVNPDEYERVYAALQERPDIKDRIILRESYLVDPGQAITFPEPPGPMPL